MSGFSDQYDRAGLLSQVAPDISKEMARSGLLDGDLEDDEVPTRRVTLRSVNLKPSQTSMEARDVVGIALEMIRDGGGQGEDLGALVSSDGSIMDGHHRWAASILARGSQATVTAWQSDLPGYELVRVLNISSKGLLGRTQGNPGPGSLSSLSPIRVLGVLGEFLERGRSHPKWGMSPGVIREILENEFGTVEEALRVISNRAKLIPKETSPWAPQREDMPVIPRKSAPEIARVLSEGVIDWNAPYADANRVARVYRVRKVTAKVAHDLGLPEGRVAGQGFSKHALQAVAEAFWRPEFGRAGKGRTAGLGGLRAFAKRLKQVGEIFTKAPRLWEDFKKLVGVKSLTDLPGKLKDLAKQGYDALHKALGKAFNTFPLQMFLIKGAGLNDFLVKFVDKIPGMKEALGKVKAKADYLGEWLRQHAPRLSTVVVVAVFIFIWLNVVEFEWNLKDITAALVGKISLGDLLASLPGSAIGFLMNGFGFGTFTLLPAAVVARMLWLMSKNYITWDGRWFQVNEPALKRDGYELGSF